MVDCVSVGVLLLSSESVLHLIKLHLTALCREVCVCVCACVRACVCMLCVYVHVCICVCMCVCMLCVYVCVCMLCVYVHVCICVCMCMYAGLCVLHLHMCEFISVEGCALVLYLESCG